MSWFKVDDGLHDHRKTRKVRRSHPKKRRDVGPFGLWVLGGSWAGANATNGFVPTEVLEEWDDEWLELAQRLVSANLWWPTVVDGEPGYGFHDWDERNPAHEVDSGKFGNHLRWHVKRSVNNPDCPFCLDASPPTRPDDRPDDRPDTPRGSGTTSPPESSPVPSRPDKTSASADAERDFDAWWDAYPRKRGKGQAAKAYRTARKKADAETLLKALRRQSATLMAKGSEFCPYPATWLNGERWTDEETPTVVTDPDQLPPVEDSWMRRRPR